MDLQLKGQVALVTGGTKGIGRAIAETFASEGCNVAICARKEDEVKAAVAALQKKGVKAFGKAVDVGKGDQLKAWINESAEALGGIDILVSNVSGGNAPGEAGWRSNFEHDMLGAVRSVEASLPYLSKSKNGNIVMISTTAALEKFISAGPYNAMKAALLNYSGALSQDLAAKGIRVNAVSPGPIMIEGGAWDMIKKGMAPFYEATLAQVPMGRMGTADEVAAQVVFLTSPRSGFTTGTNVVIDGGITKRIQY
ncbi:MAG TPA: SDR family NAD(P)-dependent oxidoreductase [Pseudomonadales bacterium]|jgi:3-oxoacyl-[acyl-carrier protein] reductase|nr:SDR family NAD(P)-dependent oxidoreductase [Pseudomonadales bacterium]